MISKLMAVKQKCEQSLTLDNNQNINVEAECKNVTEEIEKETKIISKKIVKYHEEDVFVALRNELLKNVQLMKMLQHLVSFFLMPFQNTVKSLEIMEHKDDKAEQLQLYVLVLPHAVDHIEEIKEELNQQK